MDDKKFIVHLKIGIIKDLFSKGLITQKQMEQAISLVLLHDVKKDDIASKKPH